MKVLWYVNIVMPAAARALGMEVPNIGGWLAGAAEALRDTRVELAIMTVTAQVKEPVSVEAEGADYILLPLKDYEDGFRETLGALQPDLVHIFGTEYQYNTDLVHLCCQEGRKHVISLQGIMYQCAAHYDDGLPQRFKRVNPTIKLMRKLYYADSIALEKQRFTAQGQREKEALRVAEAVIGRTAWDKACALEVNPRLTYYHVGENLRDEFYGEDRWRYDACTPHTIFVSQSFYPIKGFHMLLEAMPELIRRYPDLKVFVGGQKPYTMHNRVLDVVVDYFFEYQRYTKALIRKYGLQEHIHYTGSLNAKKMKEQFLSCNVFLSCSTIENSSNSVGEAMLLGVPVVASRVGGIGSMLNQGEDGILYDFYDREALIDGVSAVFDSPELAETMSAGAQAHARKTHDRAENTKTLLAAYRSIVNACPEERKIEK